VFKQPKCLHHQGQAVVFFHCGTSVQAMASSLTFWHWCLSITFSFQLWIPRVYRSRSNLPSQIFFGLPICLVQPDSEKVNFLQSWVLKPPSLLFFG